MTMELPGDMSGLLVSHEDFGSRFVYPRRVDVWLPPGYRRDETGRFPVVYMHDGQNLFDPQLAFIEVAWGIDKAMTRLIQGGKIREALVVGVWNTPGRPLEYVPKKPVTQDVVTFDVEDVPPVRRDQLLSDEYLLFLVTELKPFIDATYRTLPGGQDTFIMGSSAGGLISAYAICEYPHIFGGAGCLSTHWPAGEGMMIAYLREHLPDPQEHKFYFDFGTETVDAPYEPFQRRVDEVMRAGGYTEGVNWLTMKFPGHEHSERAWSQRVDIPLAFLLQR